MKTGPKPKPLADKFWSKVMKTPTCWLWIGALMRKNYGCMGLRDDGKRTSIAAHRASWIVHHGPIPKGMWVLHKCDNTSCVNPDHLFLGTHQDNMEDMVRKGRATNGERNGQAKLTAPKVEEIRRLRASGWTVRQLAIAFELSISHARGVCVGTFWKGAA